MAEGVIEWQMLPESPKPFTAPVIAKIPDLKNQWHKPWGPWNRRSLNGGNNGAGPTSRLRRIIRQFQQGSVKSYAKLFWGGSQSFLIFVNFNMSFSKNNFTCFHLSDLIKEWLKKYTKTWSLLIHRKTIIVCYTFFTKILREMAYVISCKLV